MSTRASKLLSVDDAAKQVRNLLNAVAKINGIECPLSVKQIKMIIDGTKESTKLYVSEIWGKVTFKPTNEDDLYIGIRISRWFDEDKFIIGLC